MNWKFAAVLLAAFAIRNAAAAENPYQPIITRNVFGLVPKPTPVADPTPPPILPDVKICGFVVNGPEVRALFAEVPKNSKGEDTFFSLSEGQTDGILQLLKINLDQQEAEIVNSGVPMRLNLRENGFKVVPVSQPQPTPPPVPSPVTAVMPPPPPLPQMLNNLPQPPKMR